MRKPNYLLSTLFCLLIPRPSFAQIIPDNSLGTERSQTVTTIINNLPSTRIDGGAIRGSNLFHSFQQFSIPEGQGAYFTSPSGITNIFSRVTGGIPSNIYGTLGVLGNANLFFLNPSGIVFGPDAQLDLHGSFIGSTADGVLFDRGFLFSATNPQAIPLLSINIPIGLQFRDNPGSIVNQSTAIGQSQLTPLSASLPFSQNVGLAVNSGQTLALIGGDVINQGNLTASNGQILLGSLSSQGLVSFTPTNYGLGFSYDTITNFGNITLANGSLINTSGLGGGKVGITGGNVTLNGAGIYGLTLGNINGGGIDINAQQLQVQQGSKISTLTSGNGVGGDINIYANSSVEISGLGNNGYQQFLTKFLPSGSINPFDPQIVLNTGTSGTGNAGNIIIDTGKLLINNGAILGSATLGAGNAGNMNISANIFDIGGSAIDNGTTTQSTGKGGNFTFEGEQLTIHDSAVIASISHSKSTSGNIDIVASESVDILRTPTGSPVVTGINTSALGLGGSAGNITIDTKQLTITDGAEISVSSGAGLGNTVLNTTGGSGGDLTIRATESITMSGVSGVLEDGSRYVTSFGTDTVTPNPGGNIFISTPLLTLSQGATISAASLGTGNAGNITIDANQIALTGNINGGAYNSQIQASVGSLYNLTNPNATANAGSVNLQVNQLTLQDGAQLSVASLGTGGAGSINVVANMIALDNQSSIDGKTVSGTGANINLQANSIQLRHGSSITTDAGNADGGNITINSNILLAFPQENSDITANARDARGGRVTIDVPYIFGFDTLNSEQIRNLLGLTESQFAALQVNPTSLLPTSDIAAISQSTGPSLQGTVTFGTSGINPAQGLVALPQKIIDLAQLITANPCTTRAASEFRIVGKGGVPPSPSEVLSSNTAEFVWVEPLKPQTARAMPPAGIANAPRTIEENKIPFFGQEVIPAKGWIINAKGEVTLIADQPNQEQFVPRSWHPLSACH